ncbi:hypothetical protein M758_UG041600 [Ceratodon purpureus]|nr:hypothetical protein M758_UG041600 [Ceratodon purpureus]
MLPYWKKHHIRHTHYKKIQEKPSENQVKTVVLNIRSCCPDCKSSTSVTETTSMLV